MPTHTTEVTFEVEIEYTYDPGEKRVDYYPDGSGFPGTPPSVRIDATLTPSGENVQLPADVMDSLEAEILENHTDED